MLLPLLQPGQRPGLGLLRGPRLAGSRARAGCCSPASRPAASAAITSADLVIVPALAADRRGNRLGRGGGSYDRALARVGPAIPSVALLYDGELLDEVPAGPQDQRVRAVARPGEGITSMP